MIIMKKVILLTALISTCFVSAQGFGIKGGLNLTNLTNFENTFKQEVESENIRTSFHIGIFNEFEVTEHFSIQPEVLYSSQGTKYSGDGAEDKVRLDYINVPIMFKFYLGDNFFLESGPQVGFLINDESNFGFFTISDEDAFNSVDFGLNLGLGFKLGDNAHLNARYGFGFNGVFSDLPDNSDNNPKNSVFGVSIAFNM